MQKRPRFSSPPSKPRFQASDLLSKALADMDAGRLHDAENAVRLLLIARPKDGDALNVMGVIELRRGNHEAAISAFKRAVAVQKRNPGVHCNLGSALLRSGQPEAALAHYETATKLKPRYADAQALKGDALKQLARWHEAACAYEQALQSQKDNFVALHGHAACLMREGKAQQAVEALSAALESLPLNETSNRAAVLANLGVALLQTGQGVQGLSALVQAAKLLPESNEIAHLLASNLQNIRTVPDDDDFADVLEHLLARDDIGAASLASAVVAKLKSRSETNAALRTASQSDKRQTDETALKVLAEDRILEEFLKKTPVPDRDIELALTAFRRHCLLSASSDFRAEHLEFIVALAHQCYLNEYIYSVTVDEEAAVSSLMLAMGSGSSPDWADLALAGCYRPLHQLEGVHVDRAETPPCVGALLTQQIYDPQEEQAYAAALQALTPVDDEASKAVQFQYEANPYPRWNSVSRPQPRPMRQVVSEILPHLSDDQLPVSDSPHVLIAGCGTGLETMRVVSSYTTASVLAVDLSRSSLAYAMRKLEQFRVVDIDHKQADILELERLERRFDLVHSFGVIHHMAEPQRGLDVLAGLLKPGGLIYVGLYSALARGPVNTVRDLIARQNIEPTSTGIRNLRRQIMLGKADSALSVLASPASDFWAMSDCRDLMFHVQEHQFTLIQIEQMFARSGLEFLGLQIPYAPDLAQFRLENPSLSDLSSLSKWHDFEERHPTVFGGTYRLWARKPAH